MAFYGAAAADGIARLICSGNPFWAAFGIVGLILWAAYDVLLIVAIIRSKHYPSGVPLFHTLEDNHEKSG